MNSNAQGALCMPNDHCWNLSAPKYTDTIVVNNYRIAGHCNHPHGVSEKVARIVDYQLFISEGNSRV